MKKVFLFVLMALPTIFWAQDDKPAERERQPQMTIKTATEDMPARVDPTTVNQKPVEEYEFSIDWITFDELPAMQAKDPRKVMIDVYTQWCGPCKMLDKNTFHNKDVAEYVNEKYYGIKFDAEYAGDIVYQGKTFSNPDHDPEITRGRNGVHELTRAFNVGAYPTVMFLDENSDVITSVKGYLRPTQLEIYLKLFAEDKYLEIDTKEKWEEHQVTFEPEFKD